jgi:hypothetical protein
MKIRIKSKKGVVAQQTSAYQVKLMHGTFAATLAAIGLTGTADVSGTVSIPVSVIFESTLFQTTVSKTYTAKAGKTGRTK